MKPERRAERVESVGAAYAIAKIVLLYAVFAALWVLLSDKLIGLIFGDSASVAVVATLKGWAFVAVTSLLLWVLLRRLVNRRLAREPGPDSGSLLSPPVEMQATPAPLGIGLRSLLTWPFFLLAATVVALALGGISYAVHHQKQTGVARLQAIADLKTSQISAWLWERQGDAEFVHGSHFFAELYRRWRDEGDLSSQRQLVERLREYQKIYRYQNMLVLDDRGEAVMATTGDTIPDLMPPLRATARRAIAEGRVVDTGPYRSPGDPTILFLDFVAPLPTAGHRARPAVVLRVDPEVALYPLLRSWPIPSVSAETRLFRREGDRVVFVDDPRRFSDAATPASLPVTAERSLAARALRGETKSGGVVEGIDHRGVPAVGVVSPVPGTDWFLLAKLDRAELYAPVWGDAVWIGLVGALTLFAAAAVTFILQKDRQLRLSLLQRQRQADRLEALQQLANERGRLRTLIQTIPDLVWLKDLDGFYLGCNPAFERFFGAKEAGIVGKTDHDFVSAELADFFRRKDQEAIAVGKPSVNEEWITFADDGRRALLETIKTPISDADGRLMGVLGIGRDITDRKRMEEALRASEARYRTLFDSMTEGFAIHEIVLDQNGKPCDYRFLDVNPAFERLTGLKRGDVLGKRVLEILPDTEPYWIERYGDVALTGEPAHFENYLMALSRWYEVYAYRSAPQQFAVIFMDVTEHRVAEEQLRKLLLAVEQSPESIVITDLDGRIEYVNAAFVAISGYRPEEALGQNPRILGSGKTPAATFAELWGRLAQGEAWQGEFVNRRKNGEEYVEFARIAPIRQLDGRITHYLAIKADITDKKRLELELDRHRHHLEELVAERTAQLAEARERAEVANRAKSAFLANMSHEIRTPMNAIIGFTHSLERDIRNPVHRDRLGKVMAAARYLLALLNDVLDLSKIEAGKLVLEQTDFDLGAAIDRVRALMADKARAKGLDLRIELDPALGGCRKLRGDSTRLTQLLLNYLGNALKFTEQGSVVLGGRLLVERADEVLLRFEVRDTGPGIAPEALPRLFAAFEQADGSTTRRFGGTGLGLAIARRLAELMGGEAGVESVLGEGSTFWFTAWLRRGRDLPRAVSATAESAAEAELRRRSVGARLLLVEDNPINQEVALDLLREVGFAVDLAEDGQSAVDRARTTRYDLVLMDVQMPVLDGLDATRAIRRLPGCDRVPILAMTANAFDEDRQVCLAAGMNDHVGKPVDPDVLFAGLLKWLPERPEQVALQAGAWPSDRSAVATTADRERARIVLAELDALLAEDDIRANATFRESAPLLRAVLGDTANEVQRQIDAFEYEEALHALRAAVAERWDESDA